MTNNKKRIFISYSWDNEDHQRWVIELANVINDKGGEAIVDKTHMVYGAHMKTFMIKSIQDSDVTLIILTPNYKSKADSLNGGAGFEYNLISDELFRVIQSNRKFIPVLREGDFISSTTNFLSGFKSVDLRRGPKYSENLGELLKQIFSSELDKENESKAPLPMETNYKNTEVLKAEMLPKALSYFNKLFLPEQGHFAKAKLQIMIKDWEEEIDEYSQSVVDKFNPEKMEIYEGHLEDFKNNIFAKELWTVKSALKTKDPELARYKRDYRDADAEEIFNTVNGILNMSHDYVSKASTRLDYTKLKKVEDLEMEYLNGEEMFMNRVIGYGIRSEILHRYFPSYFPVMTQKNLWAMYFICESSNEFITIESKVRKDISRVSHNWQYPYDRFTYLMALLWNFLQGWLADYGIKLNPKYRFGYINLFLYEIHNHHLSDIKLLHEWADSEKYGRSSKQA